MSKIKKMLLIAIICSACEPGTEQISNIGGDTKQDLSSRNFPPSELIDRAAKYLREFENDLTETVHSTNHINFASVASNPENTEKLELNASRNIYIADLVTLRAISYTLHNEIVHFSSTMEQSKQTQQYAKAVVLAIIVDFQLYFDRVQEHSESFLPKGDPSLLLVLDNTIDEIKESISKLEWN